MQMSKGFKVALTEIEIELKFLHLHLHGHGFKDAD